MLQRRILLPLLVSLALGPGGPAHAADRAPTPDEVRFFETTIRPLLADHCYKCHGPDKQQASLRLDSREGLLKGGDSGTPLVPADRPEQGLLLRAVSHQDDTLKMPPKQRLSDRQLADLRQWVKQGAPYPAARAAAADAGARPKSWAFRPVVDPPTPSVKDVAWPLSPLDHFIMARLEANGLKPAPLADRRTLLRRVTFDLTGLPPTPEEIAAFLADESPGAFARVVERLLASPHYGERWGRHWLDVARYADTAGDGADYPVREAYRYRNWVIDAFNADRPFDQFVREQVAGDVLARRGPPGEYAGRVIATGFLAVGKRYGYNPGPDFQHLDFADTIDTVGRSLLGLSLGCARCHDHKYDPVSQADYYALYGILQSTKWSFPGGEEHKRPADFPALVPPEGAVVLEQARKDDLARLDGELRRLKAGRAALDPRAFAGGIDLGFEGQALDKPPGTPWYSAGPNTVRADAQSPYAHAHPAGSRGVRLESGKPTDGVRYVLANALEAAPGRRVHFTIDFRTVAPADQPGAYRFYLGHGVIGIPAVMCSVTATEFAVRGGSRWEVVRKLEPGTWYTLQLTLDPAKKTYGGLVGKPGDLTTFADRGLNPTWDGILDTFFCDATGHVPGPPPVHDLDNIGLREAPFAAPGSPAARPLAPPPDLKERLAKIDAEQAATSKLREAAEAREVYATAYGVSEGTPVNARVQLRGEPDRLGAEVPRRFLAALGGDPVPPDAAGSGRLELAEWLTRPSNPLTARVFVNRVWQWHFGRGLVPTPSDFGTRGEPPSHPELLDWLASRFVASGWSVKALHRLILLSRVYQLASDDEASLQVDPENKLLARHARRPLDAESIRDALLAVGGRLDRSVPAGHPFPPVNTWGFTIHNPFHAVYDHNHRSVYLMVQRNRRHPFLALFGAADPNLSAAERLPTTTPTQALYLMNAPFVHEQSEAFARRLLAAPGDDTARARLAFESAHGRLPDDAEVRDALAFVAAYRAKLAGRGVAPDRQALLAWAALGRVVLTSNAFLYVD